MSPRPFFALRATTSAIIVTCVAVVSVFGSDPQPPRQPGAQAAMRAQGPKMFVDHHGEHILHMEQPDNMPAPADRRTARMRSLSSPVLRGSFTSVQVNVDGSGMNIVGDAANEPSIAVSPIDPNEIVVNWRQFDTIASNFRQAGVAYSDDAGQTWNASTLDPGVFRSDPVFDVDSSGNFYYNSLYTPLGQFRTSYFVSTDGGVNWTPLPDSGGGDKQWQVIDRNGGASDGFIYQTWSIFASCCGQNTFNRSTTGATTFENAVPVDGSPIFGTLAVDANSDLYIAGADPNSFDGIGLNAFFVSKSTNAKNALAIPAFTAVPVDMGGSMVLSAGPNPGGLLGQISIQADRGAGPNAGNIYALCSVNPPGSDPLDVHIVRSLDGGSSWSAPVRVNDDVGNTWQWMAGFDVAPSGRIDVVWNDTRNDNTTTFSELYYAYSTDGGQTFSANQPLTIPFNHFLGYPNQNKMGDYLWLISDDLGAHIAFAATFNGEQDVYYMRLAIDCNSNGTHDGDDIASGAATDNNGNGVPDSCETIFGDFDNDGDVDLSDFSQFSLCFGGPNNPPAPSCPPGVDADFDDDGDVDLSDFAEFSLNFTGPL